MSTKKKLMIGGLVCVILTVLLTIICLPAVFAKDEDKFVYELKNDCYVIKDIKNTYRDGWFGREKLVVPSTHKGKKVVTLERIEAKCLKELVISEGIETISDNAFTYNVNMSKITLPSTLKNLGANSLANTAIIDIEIPKSVTSIKNGTFNGCTSLTNVTIPDSITSIGQSAFNGCSSLTTVVVPDGVISIGDNAFKSCSSLTSALMPDSITSIGENAFIGCKELTGIKIPEKVTSIGECAFSGCDSLETISVDGNNENYKSDNNCLLTKDGKTLLRGTKAGNIPDSVLYIADKAFEDCPSLTSVTLPDSVITIGNSAFIGCSSLASVTISDSVTTIGNSAFTGCSSLASISIPNSVTTIGNSAFTNCSSLASVTLSDGIVSIGNSVFGNCEKLKYNEYDNALYLGNDNNPYIALIDTKVEINDNVIEKNITSCKINENTKVIANSAFSGCGKLESVTIPDSVNYIGDSAFSGCKELTDIKIPNSVISIGNSAFSGCGKLESVTISDGVNYIGNSAFSGCSSLKYNEYENALYLGNSDNPYLVLIKAKKDDISSCNINENTKVIANSAFSGCGKLESVTIPDSVNYIGDSAFSGCKELTDIKIPNSVISIGNSAFSDCGKLESVTIPDSVTTIGAYAFNNCSKLTQINFSGSLAQWDGILKNTDWDEKTCNYTVHCADGDLSKSES